MADQLFSITQNDLQEYHICNEISAKELIKTAAEAQYPYMALTEKGTIISEAEYAELEQSEKCGIAIAFDLDRNNFEVSVINHGEGGIADNFRTEENTEHQKHHLGEFRSIAVENFMIEKEEPNLNANSYILVSSDNMDGDKQKLLETAVSRVLAEGEPSDFINQNFYEELSVRAEGDNIRLEMLLCSYEENQDMSVYHTLAVEYAEDKPIEIPCSTEEIQMMKQTVQEYQKEHGKTKQEEMHKSA